MTVGPPRRIVVPSSDFAAECRVVLRSRIGRIRSAGKVVVIPHGVPVPPRSEILARDPIGPGTPLHLIAVTRLHGEAKRPWDLLEIAAELRRRQVPFTMTIVGDGPCREPMQQYVLEQALDYAVYLPGPADRDQVRRALMQADILLSTSDTEAFGLSIAEALACGCAVVASDVPGPVREMVIEGVTGLRAPIGDVAAFATALGTLSREPGRVRTMGLAGHDRVARRFSLDKMASRYAALVRRIAPRTARPGWRPPNILAKTPAEAVGPGLAARLRLRWLVDLVREPRKGGEGRRG